MRNNIHFQKGREDRQFYADQIPGAWEQMIAATRTFGWTVVSSRIDLAPDDWRELVTEDCPFDLAVACRIVKGVQGQQIPNASSANGPFCFYELIHLEEPIFRYGLDHRLVSATCSPAELAMLRKRFKAANG
jgi:hypothetical protein